MRYEIINEELKIATVKLEDITLQEANEFLNHWEGNAKLSTLSMFYDRELDLLVLNQNHPRYGFMRVLAEYYMSFEEPDREQFEKTFYRYREEITVMKSIIRAREINNIVKLLRKQDFQIPDANTRILLELEKLYTPHVAMIMSFRYGVMKGKQIERQRKK